MFGHWGMALHKLGSVKEGSDVVLEHVHLVPRLTNPHHCAYLTLPIQLSSLYLSITLLFSLSLPSYFSHSF